MRDRQPLDLPSVMIFCCRSIIFLKLIHNLFLGGSPGYDFFGTTTMGLAQGDILLVITPALSRVSISSCTYLWCLSAKVYGLELTGGLSPVSMSIVTNCVQPISSFPLEKTLGYFSQSTSKVDLVPGVMSASCRSTFLGPGISTGDVMKALSRGMIGILYLACVLRGM